MALSADIVKKSIKISDEDIAKDYKDRIEQFSIPGKRHIQRMSFIDREKAIEAHKELSKGGDFMAVAKKYGFKEKGADMGFVDKSVLLDSKVSDIAFALQKGKFSDPVASSFSTVIVQVVDIKPGIIQKKLGDVKEQIRIYLLNERASDRLGNLQDTIEDDRAGGKALADIAKDLELEYRTIEAVDRSGQTPKGKDAKGFPRNQLLLKNIFASDVGVENEPVEVNSSGIFWPEVLSVTAERLKKLEEVKKQLIKTWKERQKEAALSKLASASVNALRKGKKLKKLAKKFKAKVKKSKAFTRSQEHDDIPVAAVKQAFVLPVGGIGMNSLAGGKGRVLFKVVAKGEAKPADKAVNDTITARLRRALEDDVVGQYIATLRKNYGVSINEKVLARLNGTTQ
ncbi:MAG: peptidyl-prolyl cis-trans isomerase [Hyphomicrobiaceae bacterium]|nr:peptidyl-prolyl cis-trans isomerase [Hyphomicrobiaceae bacterium]